MPADLVCWETSRRSWGSCKAVLQIGSPASWHFPSMQGCFGCFMSTSVPWSTEKPILQLLLTAGPPFPAGVSKSPHCESPPKPCTKMIHELTKLKVKQALCGSDPSLGHVEQCPCSTLELVAAGPACVIQSFFREALWFSATSEPSPPKSCWVASTEHKALACTPSILTSQRPGHPVASLPSSTQPPNQTKVSPLPAGREQGVSLKLGCLSSGPQPACNGWKPRDAIGQQVPGGGYRPCPTEPLGKAVKSAAPTPTPGAGKQEEQQAAFFPERFWQLHRFPRNINNYPAIWNQPWAGQQKVSPRLCPISAGYSVQMQKASRRWHSGTVPTRMQSSDLESCSDLIPEVTQPWKRLLQPALPSMQGQSCAKLRAHAGAWDAQPLPGAPTGLQGA